MKRALVVLLLVAACGAAFWKLRGAPTPAPSPSPVRRAGSGVNLVLVTIDTLRADHLGAYGYRKPTSPNIDALAARGAVFERSFTHWPKTRGSFVMMMTGRRAAQNGYSKTHPVLLDFNATLAGVLSEAGYATAATLDNANLARQHGYAKGFARYRETWQEAALPTEMDRTRAITADGVEYLKAARADQPFFLWLHYVNPHAPYTPPAPNDSLFVDAAEVAASKRLPVVPDFRGGIHKAWAVPGQDRLAWYVAQYDGEIRTVDAEVGQLMAALEASAVKGNTLVVLTSDHGESLGEHDYYFDHGQDVFDPCLEVPLIMAGPAVKAGTRSQAWASTLDLLPTVFDMLAVSYPPELAGRSLAREAGGSSRPDSTRLFAQNDHGMTATWDEATKLVATPRDDGGADFELYARVKPEEKKIEQPDALRGHRREIERYIERQDREWVRTRGLLGTPRPVPKMSKRECENLESLGYLPAGSCRDLTD